MASSANIHEAQTHLSHLVDEVAEGAEFIIARSGRPVARLVPLEPSPRPKVLGLLEGMFDVPDDFDAPLPMVAQAMVEPLVLVTRDEALAGYGDLVRILRA